MKRILSIILCITVLFTLCFTVNASSSSTLKGNSECVVGENISLTLDISNCPDVTSIGVSINTGDAFEFVSYEWLQDATLKGFYEDQLDGALAFDKSTNINGELITVTLKALSLGTEEKVSVRIIGKNAGDTVYQETVTKSIDVVCGKHDFGPAETFDADNHKQVCKLCNAEIISAHNWDKGTVTRTATCISAGNKRFTCSTCGQVKNEEIPKLSFHTFNDWKVEKEATCTESGTEIRICSYCQAKETRVIEATGHKYGDWEVENKATCTESGTEARACEYCGEEETRAIGATGHNFNQKNTSETYLKSAATCTKKAVYYYSCTCGEKGTETFESGDLAAHSYKTEWSKDSTKHWHECSVCGNKKDEAAHTPGAAATETTPQTCTTCGYVIKEAIGHVHSYTEKNTDAKYLKSAATCTAKAVYYYSCSCGEKGTETFESGETLAHTWETKWANNDSKHWHECTVCKTKGDEADHAFEWKIDKEATVTEAGAKHEECKVCGYKKTAIAIDKLAPSIIDGRNAKWNKGGENNMTFKSDAAFSDFVEVLVDGKTITAENYEKREGSIIIELKASYLETLAEGEHTLTIRSASGDATTKFTVEAEIVSPPTGSTNVWGWIIIGVVALGIGAAVDVFIIRKRKTA